MAALSSSDILVKYSTTAGSAGNANTGAMASSWGKNISTTQVTDNTLNNLFPDWTASENGSSVAKYVCIFVHNSNGSSNPWNSVGVYISTLPSGLSMAVSWDTTGVTTLALSGTQAKTIASVTTAPASQTFTSPTSPASPLLLGGSATPIPAGSVAALWVRLTGTNGTAFFPDTEVLTFTGTT